MEVVETYTPQNKKTGYMPWVDVCKGALLYLVVIGHMWYCATPAVVNTIIYSFHMPAFFILSGYVLNTERKSKSMFIKQKMVSLLVPAYICIIATLPLYIKSHGISIDLLKKLFYVDGRLPYNDPCWFFITLFMVMCVVCFVNLSARTTCEKALMGGGSFMLGEILYHIGFDYLGLTKLFIAMGFLILGAIIRDIGGTRGSKRKYFLCLIVPLLFATWIVTLLINGKVSLYGVSLGNYFLFLTAGICGSLCFIVMIKYLLANSRIANPLIRVGNNTILVVGTHYIFVTFLCKVGGILQISHTWMFSLVVLVTAPLIIAFYVPVSEYVTKYLPVVNGKMKIK